MDFGAIFILLLDLDEIFLACLMPGEDAGLRVLEIDHAVIWEGIFLAGYFVHFLHQMQRLQLASRTCSRTIRILVAVEARLAGVASGADLYCLAVVTQDLVCCLFQN